MIGKTATDLVDTLNNTKIDPDAAEYMDKYPAQRYWLAGAKKAKR